MKTTFSQHLGNFLTVVSKFSAHAPCTGRLYEPKIPNTKILRNSRKKADVIVKTNKFFGVLLLLLIGSIIAFSGCQSSKKNIDLKQFKTSEEEYQYANTRWGDSLEEVQKGLPYTLEKVKGEMAEGLEYYKTKDEFTLDGQRGDIGFEFWSNKLRCVAISFNFDKDKDYQKWFDTQLDALTEIYGKEKEINENADLSTKAYKWTGKDTALVLSMTIFDDKVIALIEVGED